MDDALRDVLYIIVEVLDAVLKAMWFLPGRERWLARLATARALLKAYKI